MNSETWVKSITLKNSYYKTTRVGSYFLWKADLLFISSMQMSKIMRLHLMKLFILAQYFTVTMVLTITAGLFALKPAINQDVATTAQAISVMQNKQEISLNAQYK